MTPATTSLSFDIYLRAAPEQVHAALSDSGVVPRWLVGMEFRPRWTDDPSRLSCEWLQTDCLGTNGGSASVVRFEIAAMGQVTRLKVIHRELVIGGSFLKAVEPGWPMILSSLKSLIETGSPLEFQIVPEMRYEVNR